MARQIAKDHDQKREHILKTAARVFAEEGFARASMAQVAKACAISKANIYHYYGSKDALLFDILDSYLSELRDRVCGLDLGDLDARDKLHRIVSETLLAYEGMDHEHQIQTEGIPLLPEKQQTILKGYQLEMVQFLSDVLAEAAPASFDGDPKKLRAATMSVFGMLNWFYRWNGNADRKQRLDYAELVSRMTLDGITAL